MCEQTQVSYLQGDVVWVKLGPCWWPGEVQDMNKLPEEIKEDLGDDTIAAIKFFEEDKFEYISNLDHICLYNCRRKMEFIKKGLDMYRTKKKEGSTFMDKFPDDVARAEELTGGDPQILANNEFAPKEKTLWKDIFYEEKKQRPSLSSPIGSPRNAKNSSSKVSSANGQQKVSLPRRITHPRFLKVLQGEAIDHEVRIRQQPGNLINPPNVPLNPYSCPSCNFTSFRINVIILHNKYHHASNASQSKITNRTVKGRKSGVSSSRGRTKVKQLDSLSTESHGKSFREEDKSILSDETKLIDTGREKGIDKKSDKKVIFGSKRKGLKKLDHATKKKKSNEEIREKLLADWEDDDDEQEEQELQMLKQVISKNTPTTPSVDNSKLKEISCFDFDESADSMLDTELEERAKRFAENLKFPRILEDKGDNMKSKTFDSRHSSEKSKNSLNPSDIIDDSCHIVNTSSNEASKEFSYDTSDISENSNGKRLSEVQSVIALNEPTTDSANEVSIICEGGVQNKSVIGKREECLVTLGSSDGSNEIPTDIFSSNLQPNLSVNDRVKNENASIMATRDKEIISDLEAQFESVMAETVIPNLPEIPENRILSDIREENSMVQVSGSSDHDYSTRIKEARKEASSDQGDLKNRSIKSTAQTYCDNDMELDINALPVVVADALIKNEHVTKSVKDGDINLSSVKQMHTDESSGISSGELNSQSCSTPANVVKVIKSTPKSNVGTIDTGSQYVIIQQSSSQQGRFPAKAIQQCVALKTVVQQQSPSKKVVIVTPSQGQIQHDAVHQSGPNKISTVTQRVITSSGSIVTTAVPSKTILQKGATLVSVPQQQIKILSGSGKHVLGSKLMMQSTQTKVSLPSMQTLQKVSVVQTAAGRISGGVTKSKGSTILIQTAPGTISTVTKTISTVGSPTQTLPRLQMARSKQQASPSGTSTVQRTILNAASSANSATQPTMIIQRLQGSRTANVLVSNEQAKKVTGIFPRSHVLQRTVVPPTHQKIGPIPQQKSTVISSGQVKGRIVIQSTKQKVGSLQPSLGDIDQTRQQICSLQSNTIPSQQVASSSSANINLTTGTNPSTTILTSEQLAQIMGPSAGQIAAEPGTLVFVTINESGNIEPIDSSTLVAYDTADATINKAANALYIDSSSFNSSNVDKLIFTLNDQTLDDNTSVAHTLGTSFNTTNGKRPSTSSNQDILAAAIANTDVFQHEISGCNSLSGSHTDNSSGLLGTSSAMLLPSLSNPGIPLAAPGVLETSLTLSQAPIMTPLEVPSAIKNLHSPPPPPSSTSLQLAHLDSSNSTVVKTLPGFQTSMPLLSEDVVNTQSIANIGVSTSSLTYTNVSGGITCSEATENTSVTYGNFSTPFSQQPDSLAIAGDNFGTSLSSYEQVSESASTELVKDPSSVSFAPVIKDSTNVMSTIQPVEATQVYLQSLDSTSDSVPLHVSTTFSSQSDTTLHGEQLESTSQTISTNRDSLLQNIETAENSSTSGISESNQDSASQCWMERETNAALSERLQYKLSER